MILDRVFRLKTVAAEDILIDAREGIARFDKVYKLSPAAAWLWKKAVGESFSEEDLITWLCEEFDVSHPQAQQDVHELVADWLKYGIAK